MAGTDCLPPAHRRTSNALGLGPAAVARTMTDERDEMAMGLPSAGTADGDVHVRFERFVRRQYRGLVGFLRRRNSLENAEEIAQDSIVSLLRYRQIGTERDWKPLLYRIAVNQSIKRGRRDAAQPLAATCTDACELRDERLMPDEEAERTQRAEHLQAAISALPAKCRRVYLMRHGLGLSHAEIAQRCGVSVKMVEKHLATALVALRRQIGDLRDEDP